MEGTMAQYPPGDPRMIDTIVYQLKSQGIFDQFRKECIADVDTKPAYQNLHQRVESTVSGFLADRIWRPDLNKNLLRDSLRKHIHESGFLEMGVERIVDQVVNPKIMTVFVPQVEDVVYNFLGIEKPKKRQEGLYSKPPPFNFNIDHTELRKEISLTDMLPKDLDPVSPESDATKKTDNSTEEGELDDKDEEDCSPSFKPIKETNENSGDSSLSGISGLTSPESHHSSISFNGVPKNLTPKISSNEIFNSESQFSKVSNGNQFVCDDKKPHSKQALVENSSFDVSNHARSPSRLLSKESEKPSQVTKSPIGFDGSDDEDDKDGSTTSSRPSSSSSDSSSESSSDSSSSDDSESSKEEPSDVTTSLQVEEKMTKKEKNVGERENKPIKGEHANVIYEDKSIRNEKKETPLPLKVEKLEEIVVKKNHELGGKVIKKERKDDKYKKDIKFEKVVPKQEMEGKSSKKTERDENLISKFEKDDSALVKKDDKDRKFVKNHEREEKHAKKSEMDDHSTKRVEKDEKLSKKLEKEDKLTKVMEQGDTVRRDVKDDKLHTPKKVSKEDKFSKKDEKEDKACKSSEKDGNTYGVDDKLHSNRTGSKDHKDNKSLKGSEKSLHKNGDGKTSSKEGNHEKKLLKKDVRDEKLFKDDKIDKTVKRDEKSTKIIEKEKTFKKEDRHKTDTDSSSQDSKLADTKPAKPSEVQHQGNKLHKSTDKDNAKPTDKHSSKDDKFRKDGKSKLEDKSKYSSDKSKYADKSKQDNKSKHYEKPKYDDKAKEEDKTRQDDKYKTKNGKTDKDRSSNNKDLSLKEKHSKHDEEKTETKTDSKSKLSSKSKDNKKEKSKSTDDHSRHRDKRPDDRGSTDRDSNGATRDRSSSSARTQTSAKDSGNREKKSGSSGGKTGKGGNTDASEKLEGTGTKVIAATDTVTPEPKSPVKRSKPNSDALIPCEGEYICTNKEGKLILKIKKPKIAANIYEVRKIMQLRRSLAILERKRQKEFRLAQGISSSDEGPTESNNTRKEDVSPGRVEEVTPQAEIPLPIPIPLEIDVPIVQVTAPVGVTLPAPVALPAEVPLPAKVASPVVVSSPSRETSHEFDDDVDLLYFEAPEVNEYDKYFLDHMRLLNESETLSELDVCSVHSEDLDDLIDASKCLNRLDVEGRLELEKDIKHARTVDFCQHVSFERKTFELSCSSDEKSQVGASICESSILPKVLPHQKNTRLTSRQEKSEDQNVSKVSNTLFENDLGTESGLPVSIKSKTELPKRLEDNASTIPTVKPQLPDEFNNVSLPNKSSVSFSLHPNIGLHNGQLKSGSYKTEMTNNETISLMAEMGPPTVSQSPPDKRETRRSRKPNSRYSSDSYTFDVPETASQPESLSTEVDWRKKPVHLSKSKIFDIVVGGSLKDEYDSPLNNNNSKVAAEKSKVGKVESNSSNLKKKEKGKAHAEHWTQPDSSIPTPESHKSGDSSSSGSIETQNKQKAKLGPCRRLGLPRLKPVNLEPSVNQVARVVVTPIGADFVMPLSPESDVSASSMDQAKKMLLDSSPPKSEDTVPTHNEADKRNTRRSGGVATPASRGQHYSSDDLYKPRPLFNRQSRRTRASGIPCDEEEPEHTAEVAVSSGAKRKASCVTPDPAPLPKRRR